MVLAESRPGLGSSVQEYVATARPMLIDGAWVQAVSGKTFPVYDPATEEEIAQVAQGDKADVDKAVVVALPS